MKLASCRPFALVYLLLLLLIAGCGRAAPVADSEPTLLQFQPLTFGAGWQQLSEDAVLERVGTDAGATAVLHTSALCEGGGVLRVELVQRNPTGPAYMPSVTVYIVSASYLGSGAGGATPRWVAPQVSVPATMATSMSVDLQPAAQPSLYGFAPALIGGSPMKLLATVDSFAAGAVLVALTATVDCQQPYREPAGRPTAFGGGDS